MATCLITIILLHATLSCITSDKYMSLICFSLSSMIFNKVLNCVTEIILLFSPSRVKDALLSFILNLYFKSSDMALLAFGGINHSLSH